MIVFLFIFTPFTPIRHRHNKLPYIFSNVDYSINFRGRQSLIIAILALVTFLGGCASHRKKTINNPSLPGSFSDTGTATVPDRWWQELDDPALNKLIKKALQGNFSLKQSYNRLAKSKAALQESEADLYPSIDVTASLEERRDDQNENENVTESSLRGIASYEVDLWGRIESSVEAAEYSKDAHRSDLQAAAITLTAELARTWYQLVEQYAQLTVIKNQIETNHQLYRIVQNRYENGQSRAADVLRQERLLESTREQKSSIESRIGVLENSLAILIGKPPQNTVNPRIEQFPTLPNVPETGLPGKLINRRPDVRSALYQVKEANERVAVAVAKQYPRFTITGTVSTSGGDAGDLFHDWIESLAAELAVPLIDANRLESQVSQQKANLALRFNQYSQTVLESLGEVEDAIVQENKQREQLQSTEEQLRLVERTVNLLRQQYINGTADFLDVLDSLRNEQQLQRDLISAQRRTLELRIALYKSLAGGFDFESPSLNRNLTFQTMKDSEKTTQTSQGD